jgi:hypothetical protein
VKTLTVLFVSYIMLFSTLVMRAGAADPSPAVPNPHSGTKSGLEGGNCGGEPCDAVVRGFRAFFDQKLDGLGSNGRACSDCHMASKEQIRPARTSRDPQDRPVFPQQ